MDKKSISVLEQALQSYFKKIHKIYTEGNFREESFYSYLKELIEKNFNLFKARATSETLVLPKKTNAGIPDIRVGSETEIIGYIEVKTPDTNLDSVENSEQLKRYRNSLPNVILTNLLEFRLYRHEECISRVEVGRQFTLVGVKHHPSPEKVDLFYELLEKFFSFSIPAIKTSQELSMQLAKRARFLEAILQEELLGGNQVITGFYEAFKKELMETLTKEKFADLYAQTIAYGLFAARMKIRDCFGGESAWDSIPESLPLLREIFHSFTGPHFPQSISWVVEDITQLLEKADIQSILKEFKITRWDDDPVIHFYETFLATYNPSERKRLGVYYTPLPVVSYIVRSTHKLLKDCFGKVEGLANNDVTLLDPAAGTLTFVVQAIKQVQEELRQKRKEGLIPSYIENHILKHFYAFEILMAPYTVGHFKVNMILEDMGYKFKTSERFQFYLTNSLEIKGMEGTPAFPFLKDLTREGREAGKIKKDVPILVVLGNPPYSVSSENKSKFIENLMNDYKEDVKEERNIQPLSDDYIKFIRFAHWKLSRAGKGVLGFITNNAYLSGVIHRGMRKRLLDAFDEIYILNLHGSARVGEKTPRQEKDENIFKIQQGVAVAIYVKREKQLKEKRVYYADLWGKRSRKYDFLFENDIGTTKWKELQPTAPYYFFVPKKFSSEKKYEKFWKVTDVFVNYSSGVKTHRDHLVVGFTKDEIIQKLGILKGNLPEEAVRRSLNLDDTSSWNLADARQALKSSRPENKIFPYSYRPFDLRWICFDKALVDRHRLPFMKHLLHKNLSLVVTRILAMPPFLHSFISEELADICLISLKTKETAYFFPLYLYSFNPNGNFSFDNDAIGQIRSPNFNPKFLQEVKSAISKNPAPEEIFYYIYAVLFAPTYRKQYEEFLKIDFPRIPLPPNRKAFQALSSLGKELVDIHLLKHKDLEKTICGFPKGDSNEVKDVFYDEKKKRVYINEVQFFDHISENVWIYKIGAYQAMEKYLKDRKGRKLSLEEVNQYVRIAKALQLTIKLEAKIDDAFKKIF